MMVAGWIAGRFIVALYLAADLTDRAFKRRKRK